LIFITPVSLAGFFYFLKILRANALIKCIILINNLLQFALIILSPNPPCLIGISQAGLSDCVNPGGPKKEGKHISPAGA
jgi:hypothetical protein